MAYATPEDLLTRYDYRPIAELVTDDPPAPTRAALLTNDIVLEMLEDASGEIDKALLVAGRYTPHDLSTLTGFSQKLLSRITCDIAFYLISCRRQTDDKEFPRYEDAKEVLAELRAGEAVFNIPANIDAGNPSAPGVSVQVIKQQNLVTNNRQYFPTPFYSIDQI